jgi:hypothetical protein
MPDFPDATRLVEVAPVPSGMLKGARMSKDRVSVTFAGDWGTIERKDITLTGGFEE